MPDEYISREAALMKLMQDGCSAKNLQSISDMPAADVAEVVQGSGKVRATKEAETTQIIDGCCTACGELMDCIEAAEYKFCPYCGKRIV